MAHRSSSLTPNDPMSCRSNTSDVVLSSCSCKLELERLQHRLQLAKSALEIGCHDALESHLHDANEALKRSRAQLDHAQACRRNPQELRALRSHSLRSIGSDADSLFCGSALGSEKTGPEHVLHEHPGCHAALWTLSSPPPMTCKMSPRSLCSTRASSSLSSPAFSCKSSPRSNSSSRHFWKTVSWADDVDSARSGSACREVDSSRACRLQWGELATASDARRCPFGPGVRRLSAVNMSPSGLGSSSDTRSFRLEWAQDMTVFQDQRRG